MRVPIALPLTLGCLAICAGCFSPQVHPDFASRFKPAVRSVAILPTDGTGPTKDLAQRFRVELFLLLKPSSSVYICDLTDAVGQEAELARATPKDAGERLKADTVVRLKITEALTPSAGQAALDGFMGAALGISYGGASYLRGSAEIIDCASGTTIWSGPIDLSRSQVSAASLVKPAAEVIAMNWPWPGQPPAGRPR